MMKIIEALQAMMKEINEGRKEGKKLKKKLTEIRGEMAEMLREWRTREAKMIEEAKK